MKIHRFDLNGTGPDNDFIIRIPNVSVYDAQIFVELLTIDTGTDNTNDVGSIHVHSKTLYDPHSYSSSTNSFNIIAQLANNSPVNTNKDFRFYQIINESDVGFPMRSANLSNYAFNVLLKKDNHVDIDSAWTWSLRLLIVDGKPKNELIEHDPLQSNYFGNVPIKYGVNDIKGSNQESFV
jgi:hypothetical protein